MPVWNEGGVHDTCAVHNIAPANVFTSILVHIFVVRLQNLLVYVSAEITVVGILVWY